MYTQSITRRHKTAFFFAIDGSGSMAEEIRFRGRTATKAEAVATVANELLFELIERARRSDGVRDYYDIALLGYSGDDEVVPLLGSGSELLSVRALSEIAPTLRRTTVEYRQPDGSVALRDITVPTWIAPRSSGMTPMCEALRRTRDMVAAWCSDPSHADSFPPVVFNITDGEATDCDDEELRAVSEQIRSLGTSDGRALLINIHITSSPDGSSLFFPSEEELPFPNRYASLLYDCSSVMPALFEPAIREAKPPGVVPPFRGVSYNASAEELVAILNIGSISVKTE